MTELEFDVLDELYFVNSFEKLLGETDLEETDLKEILKNMFEKGWIKCFKTPDEEINDDQVDLDSQIQNYLFLASKKGLMAHNGR